MGSEPGATAVASRALRTRQLNANFAFFKLCFKRCASASGTCAAFAFADILRFRPPRTLGMHKRLRIEYSISTMTSFDQENLKTETLSSGSASGSENAAALPRDEIEAWLRLAFVGLPAGRCNAALAFWKNPHALLEAAARGHDAELLQTPGITPTTVERLRESSTRDLEATLEAMTVHGIRLMLRGDLDYPKSLEAIPDPPPYIFVRGTVSPADEIAVAIVGTRHTTEYGRGMAQTLARDLAFRGVTVVSGLARGVDTAAHKGALEAKGRTFAVCGCGLDIVYPSENKELMREIGQNGACWSEFAPTVHPESWHFPARNRIISALSAGVIVVEAGERSGALITADFAMEQGRDVFAVPGNVHKAQSRGAHALIKQGATLVENVDDVLQALNNRALPFERSEKIAAKTRAQKPKSSTRSAPKSGVAVAGSAKPSEQKAQLRADLTPQENRVLMALEVEPRHIDDVAQSAQMGAGETNSTLVILELKGCARRLAGGMFVKSNER